MAANPGGGVGKVEQRESAKAEPFEAIPDCFEARPFDVRNARRRAGLKHGSACEGARLRAMPNGSGNSERPVLQYERTFLST
jgi:hypothetical protein